MIDRRGALHVGSAALMAGLMGRGLAAHAETAALRVGALKFGSLGWLIETMRVEKLDGKAGVDLQVVDLASNQAGPIALLSGDVDVIVSDWPWALRQRAQGEKLQFAPFTAALGAVMVPADSPIKTVKDLEGKRLGVTGSAVDKSWLLLRAYAKKAIGSDLAQSATPVYGTPPLLTEEIKNGRLDAILNFWPYAARLAGAGYGEVIGMAAVLKELGIEPVPPLVGFIWRDNGDAARTVRIEAFLGAADAANAVLASSDLAWERLKPLVKPTSDAEFAAMKRYYRSGIPKHWGDAETKSAEKLMAMLIAAGDADLTGQGTTFDAKLFHGAQH
jgi:NitT/TauT family transport system substrate-binding protein